MPHSRPLVATGQQIGVGWTPALSVVKALAAREAARRLGGETLYWMADEDHDAQEVSATVAREAGRLVRARFRFGRPAGTATGWLPWTPEHQAQAEALWGPLPAPAEPSLRGHVEALGRPLWERGIRPYSPTRDADRAGIQPELARWRALGLEAELVRQAERLEAAGSPSPLDPRQQAAWFALDPATGARDRLEPLEPLPPGRWLSPGAALRPLMQSLLLPVTHVVLGPAERAYWRLAEPLWERVGLEAPVILARPGAVVVPKGLALEGAELEALRAGDWSALAPADRPLPSSLLVPPGAPEGWEPAVRRSFEGAFAHLAHRLRKLDRRVARQAVADRWGRDPERVRQELFPFGRPQERVLPGWTWLRDEALLDRIAAALPEGGGLALVEDSE